MASAMRWDRRSVMKASGLGAMAALTQPVAWVRAAETSKVRNHIKQSVCRGSYGKIPLEKLAAEAKRIGYQSIELLVPEEVKVVKSYGLTCAMLKGVCKIPDCLNRKAERYCAGPTGKFVGSAVPIVAAAAEHAG